MYHFVGLGVFLPAKPFMLMSMQATYGYSEMAVLGFLILVWSPKPPFHLVYKFACVHMLTTAMPYD